MDLILQTKQEQWGTGQKQSGEQSAASNAMTLLRFYGQHGTSSGTGQRLGWRGGRAGGALREGGLGMPLQGVHGEHPCAADRSQELPTAWGLREHRQPPDWPSQPSPGKDEGSSPQPLSPHCRQGELEKPERERAGLASPHCRHSPGLQDPMDLAHPQVSSTFELFT